MRDHTYKIVHTLYMTVQVLQQLGKSCANICTCITGMPFNISAYTYDTTKIEPPQIIMIPKLNWNLSYLNTLGSLV